MELIAATLISPFSDTVCVFYCCILQLLIISGQDAHIEKYWLHMSLYGCHGDVYKLHTKQKKTPVQIEVVSEVRNDSLLLLSPTRPTTPTILTSRGKDAAM